MDLLLDIPTTRILNVNDLKIVVEEIDCGWMDLCINISTNKHFFSVSYICDPLNDLLESTVLLLTGQPMKEYIYQNWINITHCRFELETDGGLHWIFRKIDKKWFVYLWHNAVYEEELSNLYYSDFDSDKYEKYLGYDFEGFPNLKEGLIFAVEIDPVIWAQILIETFEQLHIKYKTTEYQECWGVKFDKDNFEILKNF